MQNEVGRFFGVRLLCDKCIWTSTVRFDSTRGLTVELIREVQGYVPAPPRLLVAQPAGGPDKWRHFAEINAKHPAVIRARKHKRSMEMMRRRKPTEELEHEHHVIQKVVGAMAVLVDKLESGKVIDCAVLTALSEFMHTFGDKCHHGKEENYLFKLLAKKGVQVNGCPLAVLLHEHEKGRSLLADLKLTSETYIRKPGAGREALLGTLRQLIGLYPAHIWKEDYLLFPMTDKILSASEQAELAAQFGRHESEIGADVHHGFEQLAGRILEMICCEASTCLT